MSNRKKFAIGLMATTAALASTIAIADVASAATVTNGTGFIGKGEVQSAFSMNNRRCRRPSTPTRSRSGRAADHPVAHAGRRAGRHAGRYPGRHPGRHAGRHPGRHQVVGQDLTCTYTNGNGTKVFHRDGVRDGVREGNRDRQPRRYPRRHP